MSLFDREFKLPLNSENNIVVVNRINDVNSEIKPTFFYIIYLQIWLLLAAIGCNKSWFWILFLVIKIHKDNILVRFVPLYLQKVKKIHEFYVNNCKKNQNLKF